MKEENQKELNKKKIYNFFAHLVVVMNPISWPRFHFIRVFVKGLGIGEVVGLIMNQVILTKTNIIVRFSGLSL